jgi:FkbM family methyltransferase
MAPTRDPLYAIRERLAASRAGRAAREHMPDGLRRAVRGLLDLPAVLPLASDPRSLARLLPRRPATVAAPVRLRRFDGRPLHLRPGTADVAVVRNLAVTEPHLPPDDFVPADVALVWDLGAHIGVAAVDYAVRWPRARVVAVELEPANAALLRRNLSAFGDRCDVVEGAVWPEDGTVTIPGESSIDTNAFAVSENGGREARAISLASLLGRAGDGASVDLVKLDVEGAERRILRENTGWAERVRTMLVEVHDDYTPEDCESDLRALGFTRVGAGHEPNLVVAARD